TRESESRPSSFHTSSTNSGRRTRPEIGRTVDLAWALRLCGTWWNHMVERFMRKVPETNRARHLLSSCRCEPSSRLQTCKQKGSDPSSPLLGTRGSLTG